jgi:hypothetical protein
MDRGERELQPWVPDATDDVDFSLESGGSAGWDQFETNRRLFGTNSTFAEHLYTTKIDRSAPSYRQREQQAAKIAREIEGSTSTNPHMLEERGHLLETDGEDEEDRYSGVRRDELNFPPLRSSASNKYMPPARRAPTGHPTVPGAPVDPAIISAQMSLPEAARSSQLKPAHPSDGHKAQAGADTVQKREVSPGPNPEPIVRSEKKAVGPSSTALLASQDQEDRDKPPAKNVASPTRKGPENATEDVEKLVLNHFKAFAASEKMKVHRNRATNDRQARLKDLQSFSESFKLRTPVPTDLVGILGKDRAKQDQIVETAKKEHEEGPTSGANPPSRSSTGPDPKPPSRTPPVGKFDLSMVPAPIPERHTLHRNRQAHAAGSGRADRSGPAQGSHSLRG